MIVNMRKAVYIARQYRRGHDPDSFWCLDANIRRIAHEIAMKCYQAEPHADLQARLADYRLEKIFGLQ